MSAQELEPEMEEFLQRLVPGLARQWQGATEGEIVRIERIAGRPLPGFYRWFLLRMGRSMGSIAYPTLDFSATKVLSCYDEKLFTPSPRFLMIGYESDIMGPLHVLYDFDHLVRDDARVTKRPSIGRAVYNIFDTFREMIAWGKLLLHGVEKHPQQCSGMFTNLDGDVLAQLAPVMDSLGFKVPIQTGPCCGLYQEAHAAMVTSSSPGKGGKFHAFDLGGIDAAHLRRILGAIATETSLEIDIEENDPRRLGA